LIMFGFEIVNGMVFELHEQNTGMYEGGYFFKTTLILLFFLMGCRDDKHEEKLAFYYYPKKNVYYYPTENYFLYSLDSGKSWSKFNNVSPQEPNTLGEKLIIYTSNTDIYKDNDNHRRLYNGTLYAINTKESGNLSNGVEVIEQKKVILKKKVATEKKSETKTSKTAIGKFINKIFGKKK
ncbi:MAG: hypothetical protein ACR2KZ_14120, partial [Segetibacter sp.]